MIAKLLIVALIVISCIVVTAANVCTNITTTIMNRFYNGIQTSCGVAPPQGMNPIPGAPLAAPVAVPVATPAAIPVASPKASTTPVKKSSEAISIAVGSAVVFFATGYTLLW